jgi:hypothetical protein
VFVNYSGKKIIIWIAFIWPHQRSFRLPKRLA